MQARTLSNDNSGGGVSLPDLRSLYEWVRLSSGETAGGEETRRGARRRRRRRRRSPLSLRSHADSFSLVRIRIRLFPPDYRAPWALYST